MPASSLRATKFRNQIRNKARMPLLKVVISNQAAQHTAENVSRERNCEQCFPCLRDVPREIDFVQRLNAVEVDPCFFRQRLPGNAEVVATARIALPTSGIGWQSVGFGCQNRGDTSAFPGVNREHQHILAHASARR